MTIIVKLSKRVLEDIDLQINDIKEIIEKNYFLN